ncbi:NfeD family protein [Tessaracoccus oleiagri]|uniref:Membrane protein implicated in regulation of membrane protease activity n=1 Tax=Tessaracoccus oleiagri TaxID=686624 RepID=A0A1G9LPC8_9ACTN|nr:NfeD family protein [Tessaracoccus oleiagri]SDL63345.1 Membrane protein implicated in regulation of membrane protease activity [Tessaracoccus oleiagri]
MDAFLEWLRDNGWAGWGLLAIALAGAELFTLDLTLLMLASGALAAGVTWFVAPGLVWLQVVVGLVVAVLTLAFLRPTLLDRVRRSPGYRSALDQLVGSGGRATTEITDAGGEVRVAGQLWDARPFDADVRIEAGETVEVLAIEGITLLVHPVSPHQLPRRH